MQESLLKMIRLPARLDARQTAELLGFQENDIATLIRARLLSPLGRPSPNAVKFFSASEVLALAEDKQWLSRATTVLYEYHRARNRNPAVIQKSPDQKH